VAWILLNDKKGGTYKILFKQIISLAKSRGYQFSPSNIMSDYESGIISTLKELVSLPGKWLLLLLKSPFFIELKSLMFRVNVYFIFSSYHKLNMMDVFSIIFKK
jgi:hypothetical protein